MGDVGEGAAVDEGGVALEGLDQVGLDGVLEKRRHGALGVDVRNGDGLAVVGVGDHHAREAGLEVGEVRGQAEDRHDLGRDGDVKAVLARHAVRDAAQAVHHVAQLAVVHVHAALPDDARGSMPRALPCLMWLSSMAAQRLLAAPMAWKSPVKCRLMSSMGTTCA